MINLIVLNLPAPATPAPARQAPVAFLAYIERPPQPALPAIPALRIAPALADARYSELSRPALRQHLDAWHAERLVQPARNVRVIPAAVSSPVVSYVGGVWQCIADHEGSPPGNWATDTGNGFYGGLQFTQQTWLAYGGGQFASMPQYASAADQITVGERVAYKGWRKPDGTFVPPQGWGAWPVSSVACGVAQSVSAVPMSLGRHHHRHHHHRRHCAKRYRALEWARSQRGDAYCYGGTGPSCYDCSGLVMMAYRHAGIRLPRTTYEMQDSRKLRQISRRQARPGDIVLYGWPAYHAGLYAGHGRVFDALDWGTPVGSQPLSWPGTPIFYRVRRAG